MPTTATWPISEAPASLNIQLKVGNMHIMYTMRDVDDLKLERRATMACPGSRTSCTAAKPTSPPASRKPSAAEQAEEERAAAPRRADRRGRRGCHESAGHRSPTGNGARKPPAPPALEPTTDTDPSWCPIHRCTMERRTNERGSWYSHRLSSGAYCKGE